ncbi:uncharacterized protein [Amphiura filiformis]|uniref:uncharacterized protein n=1 Tax=Amphiura filiformis TaxID=82378 RepID=UPI003B222BF9
MSASENWETHKRVLCEVQEKQKVLHDLATSHDGDEPCTGARLQCAKAKFANLKLEYIELLIKKKLMNYLENVPQEEWSSAGVTSEDFKETRRDLKKTKAEMQTTEEEIQEMIAKANTAQEEFESKLKLLQSKLESIEQKRNKLSQLQTERSSGLSRDQLHQQRSALQKAESMLSSYQTAVAQHKQEISKLAEAKEAMQALLEDARPNLEKMKMERAAEISREQCMETWCTNTLQKLSHLSGIKEHSLHGNILTLELTSPSDTPVNGLLTLKFKDGEPPASQWRLNDAEINIESLDIADLINEAVRMNDVVFLVTQVKSRLYSHAPLRHEIETLRNRYALDWLSDEGVITVILGDKGQVVCSLSVDAGYPGMGSIKLTSVEGLHEQIALESFQPEIESPTITDWLDYLHNKVNSG